MSGTAIGLSLTLGYLGKVSRLGIKEITSRFVKSILNGSGVETLMAIPFGSPVMLNTDNTYSLFKDSGSGVASPTVPTFAGFAVAEVKPVLTYGSNDAGQYEPAQPCDVLQKGSIMVNIKDTTANAPLAGSQVYIITALNSNSVWAVGDMFTTATPTGYSTGGSVTIPALTGVRCTTGKISAITSTTSVTEVTLQSQVGV